MPKLDNLTIATKNIMQMYTNYVLYTGHSYKV